MYLDDETFTESLALSLLFERKEKYKNTNHYLPKYNSKFKIYTFKTFAIFFMLIKALK